MSDNQITSRLPLAFAQEWLVGTYEWWPAADRLSWSPELGRIYGLSQLPGAEPGFMELVHPDDRIGVEARTSTFLGSDATSYSHTFRIRRPDGVVRVILDRGAIERDENGNVRVIHGINIDVTEDLRIDGEPGGPADDQLRLSLQAAPTIAFGWDIREDRTWRIVGDTPEAPQETGHPPNFEKLARAVHPEDRDGFRAAVDAALRSADGGYRSEYRLTAPDGVERWLDERGKVEFDENGTPLRLLGMSHDVTERKRVEQELAEANALLEALFDNAPVGLGVWDSDFRFLRINRELAAINGLSPETQLGKRPDELLPDLAELGEVYLRWQHILETGESWREVEISGETPAQPGRRRTWVEDFFPVRVGNRNVGIAAVVQETTRRKEAEERLRASETRYRMLFDTIDEGFCVVEVKLEAADGLTDYRVLEANPSFYEQTGFPESILGRWLRKAAPDLEEHWYEIYGHVARTGEPVRFEQASELLGRWFDVRACPIGAQHDNHVAILFNDITARKRQQEHDRMLMGEVNHRFKNMLSVVLAIARRTAAAGTEGFLGRFGERVQALAAAQDLLIRNGWKTIPITDLVKSQLAHFTDLRGKRFSLSGPSLSLTPDAAQALGMALHELATNAAKYGALSNETGRIAIAWSVDPEAAPAPRFTMSWLEREGPPVTPPERRGFGSTVTTGMVEASTGGKVSVAYAPEGLEWRLSCPVADVIEGASSRPLRPRPTGTVAPSEDRGRT